MPPMERRAPSSSGRHRSRTFITTLLPADLARRPECREAAGLIRFLVVGPNVRRRFLDPRQKFPNGLLTRVTRIFEESVIHRNYGSRPSSCGNGFLSCGRARRRLALRQEASPVPLPLFHFEN